MHCAVFFADPCFAQAIAGAKLPGVEILQARPADAPTLSAIAYSAKAHWGYSAAQLASWREQLNVTPEFIAENETRMATIDRQIVAFYALRQTSERMELEHLWVRPERIRQGIGRVLFRDAFERAAAAGADCLTITADPQAEPFYLRMGARRVGTVASQIDGLPRELPLLVFELSRPEH